MGCELIMIIWSIFDSMDWVLGGIEPGKQHMYIYIYVYIYMSLENRCFNRFRYNRFSQHKPSIEMIIDFHGFSSFSIFDYRRAQHMIYILILAGCGFMGIFPKMVPLNHPFS